jgi:hypothetical protein
MDSYASKWEPAAVAREWNMTVSFWRTLMELAELLKQLQVIAYSVRPDLELE